VLDLILISILDGAVQAREQKQKAESRGNSRGGAGGQMGNFLSQGDFDGFELDDDDGGEDVIWDWEDEDDEGEEIIVHVPWDK
jgi:hypothetical protein